MSNTFENLEFNGLEKAFGDAKGEDNLHKIAFGDDLGVCPDIDNDNTTSPKDNNFNGILLDQGLDNTSNTLTMTTPVSTPSQIKREILSNSAEGSTNVQQTWNSEQMRAVSRSPMSHVQGIRPNPANGLPHALSYGNQHFRNPSNLRHQFNPDNLHRTSSPSLSSYSPVPYATPSSQNLNPFYCYRGPGNMFSPIPQPFDESNLRSPVNQNYGTSTPNPANPQAYPGYSLQQNYSPNAQFRSPLLNVNTHYGQPRTPPRMLNLGEFQHNPDINGSGASITRRATAQNSPKPQVKREDSTRKRPRRARSSHASEDDEDDAQLPSNVPEGDAPFVRRLITAMTDGSAAEDNEGMKKTWQKIRTTKTQRVHEKAVEMLKLCRDAQDGSVSDKKAVNHYPSFTHRFDELCIAVRTQKTICKHLLEEEYSRILANDPTFAAQRVKNNRRVNDQKKIAIEMGRRQMGQQGHGKGRKLEQITFFEEEENSADDPFSDEDGAFPPADNDNKPDPPRRKKTKKNHDSDDDFEVVTRTTPSSRKTRRENRSAQKARSKGIRSGSPVPTRVTRQKRTDQNQMQAMHSSPSSQESQFDHCNGQYRGYNLNDGSYHPTMQHSLPQMVEEHSYGHTHAYHLDPHQHHNGYSSGADQIYSDDIQGNGETDAEGFCDSNFSIFGPNH